LHRHIFRHGATPVNCYFFAAFFFGAGLAAAFLGVLQAIV
jgi:hypothetical protein